MSFDPISRVRRFNRVVTSEVGALDTSFLGRGRPLGAARVLNAIGQGQSNVASIREYLGLDSGLMSRLLRGLEDEGLIETVSNRQDARRRIARLTEAGRSEFQAYEALSNAQAETFLARHSRPEELLHAMDLVASVLGRSLIAVEEMDPRHNDARFCLSEYYAELARRFENGFEVSLSRDPDAVDMIRPRGAFLVAMSDSLPIGCVGLKGTGSEIAEIKRLWVAPSARGLGLARRLMTAAEGVARELSINILVLTPTARWRRRNSSTATPAGTRLTVSTTNPYPDTFFEKHL
jgi:DNA-binding MarR family transcriptional regulator/GNAT superfamily N-acetyltransferase